MMVWPDKIPPSRDRFIRDVRILAVAVTVVSALLITLLFV